MKKHDSFDKVFQKFKSKFNFTNPSIQKSVQNYFNVQEWKKIKKQQKERE